MAPTSMTDLQNSLAGGGMSNYAQNAAITRPNTGIPALDAIFSNSPTSFAALTGNIGGQFIPTPGPGMSIRDAYMARDVTPMLALTANSQSAYQFGQMFGGQLGALGSAAGINRMFGMSPGEFTRQLVNAGTSPMGRAAMNVMMDNPAMQQVLGGNPMGVADMVFSQRQMLGNAPGGALLSPTDVMGQTAYAAHASQFALSLQRAAYSGPGGSSMVLNPNVTRGFNFDEFAYIGLRSAQEGVGGMRGLGVSGDQFASNTMAMARVLEAVKMNVGPMSTPELFSQLARIEGPDWSRNDPRAMEANMYKLKAISGLTGGNAFKTSADISDFFRGAGYEIGPAASRALAQHVQGIQMTVGGSEDAIMRRQSALMYTNLTSPSGGDAIAAEFIRQQFGGNPEADRLYSNWQTANEYGTKAERTAIANQMYKLAPTLRGVLQNPVSRQDFMQNALTDTSKANIVRTIMTGASNEFREAGQRGIREDLHRQLSSVAGAAGMGLLDTSQAGADAFLADLDSYASGDPALKSFASNARERIGAAKTPGERRQIINNLLSTTTLREHASQMRQHMADAESGARAKILFSAEGEAAYVGRGTVNELLKQGDSDFNRGIDKIRNDRSLTPEGRRAAEQEYLNKYAASSTDNANRVTQARDQVTRDYASRKENYETTVQARLISDAVRRDPNEAERDLQALNRTLAGKGTGDDAERVRKTGIMTPAEKDELSTAIAKGDKTKLSALSKRFSAAMGHVQISQSGAVDIYNQARQALDEGAAGAGKTVDIDKKVNAEAKDTAKTQDDNPDAQLDAAGRLIKSITGKAQEKAVKGESKSGGGGGSGGGGPIKIAGTLFLRDGKFMGMMEGAA